MALDTALKIGLAPLLLAQGLKVRRRALILPEADGPRHGTQGDGPALRLLIVGDSSAAGVGARTQTEALAGQLAARLAPHHRVSWQVIARTGETTVQALDRLNATAPAPFDLAITALGVNDVTHGVPLARWLDAQARLRTLLASRFGVAHVIQSGLPPMGAFPALPQPLRALIGMTAHRYDTALAAALAGSPTATHVAFSVRLTPGLMAPDGFHPGPAGYALWADMLLPAITRAGSR